MKKENLRKYKDEFFYIPDDEYERITNYLKYNNLNKKEIKRLKNRMKEISEIKMNYLKIILNIIPEPTPRPRLSQSGIFYVKNSRANNEFVRKMVHNDEELYHFITTPCEFIVHSYFPIPKSFNKVDTILAELGLIDRITIPDWDNLGKTYSDMVQKWILSNDSLIIHGESYKHYSLKPRVEITIAYKEKHTCNHNKKLVEKSSSFKRSF